MCDFNNDERKLLNSLELNFKNPICDDDLVSIEDAVADKLQMSGFDENYNITDIGKVCESILDKLN